MNTRSEILSRTEQFCRQFNIELPIMLAPMAGACPVDLSVAVSNAGGMGGCGVLLMHPDSIHEWAEKFRASGGKAFQMNNWIPDPPPERNEVQERRVIQYLMRWHPATTGEVDLTKYPQFQLQCDAMIDAKPTVVSSIMGLYPQRFVDQIKSNDTAWFATVTSVTEAIEAEARGADVIVVQGMEAGGHRGTFDASDSESVLAGLFSLLPAVVDRVNVPVVATGGIADPRGIVAALFLGASAVQIGTGFLRCHESDISPVWSDAIAQTLPENTRLTRAFSGRLGRSIATEYVIHANSTEAPQPAPYPIQRALTASMTATARNNNDIKTMQVWTGQSGHMAKSVSAGDLTESLWNGALKLINSE